MSISSIVRALVAANASPEQILAAVEAAESEQENALERSRAKARARVQAWRDRQNGNVTERNVTSRNGSREGARVEDNLQTKNQAGQEERKKDAPEARSFPDFWSLYPNKVGKRDAEAAFLKALKRADLETILAGLRAYVSKTDDRPWCNPATWLNQDRWEDRPATVPPAPRQTAPPSRMDHGRMWANEANEMGRGHDELANQPTRYDLAGPPSGHDRSARTIELSALPPSRTGH